MNEEKNNFLTTKLFDNVTVSDLVRLTYDRNVKINQTIDEFLNQVKDSGITPSDLIALLPIIKDYLNTANSSDATLVKLLATLSKYIVEPNNTSNNQSAGVGPVELTDEDRELFNRINKIMNDEENM